MNLLKYGFILFVGMFLLNSCQKDSDALLSDDLYVDSSLYDLKVETRSGSGNCFEIVFPINLVFPDSTIVAVSGNEDMKQAIKDWRKANPKVKKRPYVQFPIDVISADGEVISVEDKKALFELKKDCKDANHEGNGNHEPCFTLNFPISITFPDGTIKSFETKESLKEALVIWKKKNQKDKIHPVLNYPLSVTLKDGSVVSVDSKEALYGLKKDCK